MIWSDGAEAKFRQAKRDLGLASGTARVLRNWIERVARQHGLTLIEREYVVRQVDAWVEGD